MTAPTVRPAVGGLEDLAPARPAWIRLVRAYFDLTKPRIVTLVALTGVPALFMARHEPPPPVTAWGAMVGIALAAASGATFNQYLDRDIDALMRRTAGRPLPSGIVPPGHALVLGFALAALSMVVLTACTNPLATSLAAFSIFYYAVVYTAWLKRRTPQNIVIGGGAGASAPLIAWAAVHGDVGMAAAALSGIVFLWTPPHFWALSLYRRDDYARARLPMLPVTHGEEETRRQILRYAWVLVAASLSLWPLGAAGPIYSGSAALLGAEFVRRAHRLGRTASNLDAIRLFRYSIVYLFLLFVMLTLDVVIRSTSQVR